MINQSKIDSIRLKDISVGYADGLKEANDEKFETIFYTENNKYHQLATNQSIFIISGKKGTGKTILAKYFQHECNKNNHPTQMLTNKDIILRQLIEKGNLEPSKNERKLLIEYTIYREFANLIYKHKNQIPKVVRLFNRKKMSYLKSVVEERDHSENFIQRQYSTDIEDSSIYSSGTFFKKVLGIFNLSHRYAKHAQYERNPYYNQLNRIKECVFLFMRHIQVNIIFDDLDEYDSIITGNESFTSFLLDLIDCTSTINDDIQFNKCQNCRVILLIRSDIIQILNNYGKNLSKKTSNCEITLNWMKNSHSKEIQPLMDLITTKIKKSNTQLYAISNQEVYDRFFPKEIKGIPLNKYILHATFGRPRDVINMLNIIIQEHPAKTKFDEKLFTSTRLAYSRNFQNELRNEMSSYYAPELISDIFNLIIIHNKTEFWKDEIEDTFCKNQNKFLELKDVSEFIDISYNFGIIGNVWLADNKKRQSARRYSWKYREDGHDYPDVSKRFILHNGLQKSLINI